MDITPTEMLSQETIHKPGPARIGIGGPVGSGKTSLIEVLLPRLQEQGYQVAVITNDLVNIEAAEWLEAEFPELDLILVESGGDNLASTFSFDLVDYWMFVIDVAGGDDIPRKRGPGVLRSNLLVINKADLAPHVRVDLDSMMTDARGVRDGRPVVLTDCHRGKGIDELIDILTRETLFR